MKKFLALLLAAMMMLSLTCASAEITTTLSEPVTIEFWHSISNAAHAAILEDLVAKFNAGRGAELGITVVPTFQGPQAENYSKVVAALKAGTAPNVTLATNVYAADYLQTDYVVDLTPYIEDETVGIADYEDIFEGLRAAGAGYAKEGTYSLPIHPYSEVLYYNTKIFEENGLTVPTTWDELNEACRVITAATGAPAFGWDDLAQSFMTLLMQYGGKYTSSNGDLYFTEDPVALQVLQMWQDNVNEGIWRVAGEDMFFSGPFANEIVPMYIGNSVEASYIPMKNPDLQWSAAPIPQLNADETYNYTSGHCIVALSMDGDEAEKYASYEFIKFMTSTEANLPVVVGNTGYLPIRQSVVDSEEFAAFIAAGNDAQKAGVAQSAAYFSEPVFTNDTTTSNAVRSAVKVMMENVIVNGDEPAVAMEDLLMTLGY